MTSITVTAIVVIVAIVLFMVLCIKGMGSIPAAFICVALVSVFADGGLVSNLTGTFISGMTENFATFFFMFYMGCAFGGLLSACGASDRLGFTFVKLLGQENSMYVIFLVSILLGLCGVAPCALVPFLAYGMLRASNLPRYIGMVAVASGTTISYTLVPGSLAPPNVLAATILSGASEGSTNIYAAPIYSMILLIFTIVLNCLYIHWLIRRARRKERGYEAGETAAMRAEMPAEEDMPYRVPAGHHIGGRADGIQRECSAGIRSDALRWRGAQNCRDIWSGHHYQSQYYVGSLYSPSSCQHHPLARAGGNNQIKLLPLCLHLPHLLC